MAGHSKWANIKHRKSAQDAKRGNVFTKIIRELTVLARQNANPDESPRLRSVIDKALAANMNKETIERAITKGSGLDPDANAVEELIYEGYGVEGIAIYVRTLSDNRNRTASEVRHAFSKHGGSMGTNGSVAYLFKPSGMIILSKEHQEDFLLEKILEAGARDLEDDGEAWVVWTDYDQSFSKTKKILEESGVEILESQFGPIPETTIELESDESKEKIQKLITALEELDDVQEVLSNADLGS